MTPRLLAVSAAVLAGIASADAFKFNLHIEPGFGTALDRPMFVSGASLKVDFNLISLGPVSPQAELFGIGAEDPMALYAGSSFGGAFGLRWRIFDKPRGSRFGNLWLDAGLALATGPRLGFDVALGAELQIIDGLQLGPLVKLYYLQDPVLLFGLSFSIGGPYVAPPAPPSTRPPETATPAPAAPEGQPDAGVMPEADVDVLDAGA